MHKFITLAALLGLSACSGNPFEDGGGGTPGNTCTGSNVVCSGEANQFNYNPTSDTITINNLPFDLSGAYARDAALDINGFRAYRNTDGGNNYVALYRQSLSGDTGAGVVATGDYLNFGYGGTVYRSNGSVSFPGEGEATYEGDYAAIRVYEGGGLGFADGTVRMMIDFEDFDNVGAIDTTVTGRRAYDENGAFIGNLPSLSGTTTGFSGNRITETTVVEALGGGATGASGTLSGIFGGNNGDEIAGVIILEGDDPLSTLSVRETGAFILDRITFVTP